MAERLKFVSKVDGWLAALMLVAGSMSLMAIALVMQRGAAYGVTAALLIGIPAIALPVWVFLQTDYQLTDEELLVRSGPLRWRVPLRDIQTIKPSRSWLSSPALSLDRLRIDCGRGRSLLVSPQEKERFLSAIKIRQATVEILPSVA